MTVTNTSHDVWLNVEIWLNDHYRVTKSRMPPGERLGIPLDAFVAGFGQRFNAARQVVQGIEVTATTPSPFASPLGRRIEATRMLLLYLSEM